MASFGLWGPSADPKKLEEANRHISFAEKALRTSVFSLKFKPDNQLAAIEFNLAAECYRAAGPDYLRQAIDLFRRSAICQDNDRDFFGAARTYEHIGALFSQSGTSLKGATLDICGAYRLSADRYRAACKHDAACRMLLRLASVQIAATSNVEAAAAAYEEAIALHISDDRPQYASEVYKEYIAMLLHHRRLEQALQPISGHGLCLVSLQQLHGARKVVLTKVLILMRISRIEEAEAALSDSLAMDSDFPCSTEGLVAAEAVGALRSKDCKAFTGALAVQCWLFLSPEAVALVEKAKCEASEWVDALQDKQVQANCAQAEDSSHHWDEPIHSDTFVNSLDTDSNDINVDSKENGDGIEDFLR